MHGLGNDFVVLDCVSTVINISKPLVTALADRNYGVGCDQVLIVEPPKQPDSDFSYRIFNADGNEVEQCGNGARCFAKFVSDKRLTRKDRIVVDTLAGQITLNISKQGLVSVDMGAPQFEPAQIPLAQDQQQTRYSTEVNDQNLNFWAVSMGNPHAVVMVHDLKDTDVEGLGTALQNSELFPKSVNVGFLEIDNESYVHLRVYERGVGETLACGTGACAAAVAGIAADYLSSPVTVKLPGGELEIDWPDADANVIMTGPATTVFSGHFDWRPHSKNKR